MNLLTSCMVVPLNFRLRSSRCWALMFLPISAVLDELTGRYTNRSGKICSTRTGKPATATLPHVATHAPHNVLFTHLCKNAQPHFASSSFHQLPVRQDHTLPQPAVSLAEILIQSPVHSMVQHNLPCHTTPKQQPHISAQGVRRAHTTSKQPTNCATPCSFRRTSKFPGWGSQCTKPCTWIMSPNVREAMPASWRGCKEGGV